MGLYFYLILGCFNLDPNRVLDIILESFENNPSMHRVFIGLLKNYKADEETICHSIGFKFQSLHLIEQQMKQQIQQHQSLSSQTTSESESGKTNSESHSMDQQLLNMAQTHSTNISSLYAVASYLLKYKIIDLDQLTPHVRIKMSGQCSQNLFQFKYEHFYRNKIFRK